MLAWLLALGQAVLSAIAIAGEWISFIDKDRHGYSHYATDRGMTIIFTMVAAPLLASAVLLLWRHRAIARTVVIGQLSLTAVAGMYLVSFAGVPVTIGGWLVITATILLPVAIAAFLARYPHVSPSLSQDPR